MCDRVHVWRKEGVWIFYLMHLGKSSLSSCLHMSSVAYRVATFSLSPGPQKHGTGSGSDASESIPAESSLSKQA
jgi:hypothetical protein